jgi:SAM-dependent methyltransferase
VDVQKVLELGCGGCTILQELKASGYDVVGIDPSPLAGREGKRRGLRIINRFFPTNEFKVTVDLIFHNDVLEHVDDPVGFLQSQRKQLNPNGLIITAVPDCTEGVLAGEISMTMHQHLNYFDLESLKNVFQAAGLEVLVIERALYGGSIYCCARKNNYRVNYASKSGQEKLYKFYSDAEKNTRKFAAGVASFRKNSKSLGFYAPLRALPYLAILGMRNDFRFFDDTNHWYNRYFDGVDVPIENFNDLKAKPVDTLFIMSTTFGEKILTRINRGKIQCDRVVSLKKMLDAG